MSSDDHTTLATDVLRGATAIAAFIGLDERNTYTAPQRGYLPAQKEGKQWVSTKSRLTAHYNPPPPKE
jgi:hypothetical protein